MSERGDRIREIRERLVAAAKGPWRAELIESEDLEMDAIELRVNCGDPRLIGSHQAALFWTWRLDDAELCAHARTDLPWALGEIERLERVLDGLCMFVETAVGLGDTKIPNTLGWVVADARKALKGGDANG